MRWQKRETRAQKRKAAEGEVINLEGAVNQRVGREGGGGGSKFEGASKQAVVVTPIAWGQITLGSVDTRQE